MAQLIFDIAAQWQQCGRFLATGFLTVAKPMESLPDCILSHTLSAAISDRGARFL
jgi:hypothetical protein